MQGKRNESGSAIATGSGIGRRTRGPYGSGRLAARTARSCCKTPRGSRHSDRRRGAHPRNLSKERRAPCAISSNPRRRDAPADGRVRDSRLGFVLDRGTRDYFTLERHGHVGILAVTAGAEGRGAGRALLRAAETWARDRGFQTLTLNVFSGNDHARAVYEHLGFEEKQSGT